MMKSLLIAALMVSSSSAMASSSRVTDLQGSLTSAFDHQDAFAEPAVMWSVADAFVAEYSGATGQYGTLIRSNGDAKWGVWLGRQSAGVTGLANKVGFAQTTLDNPFYVAYSVKGDGLTWGAGLFYANSKKEKIAASYTKSAMGLNLSAVGSNWRAYLNQGLSAKIETQDAAGTKTGSFAMKGNTKVGGQYDAEGMSYAASYTMAGAKEEDGTATILNDIDTTELALYAESAVKGEAANFFYGAGFVMSSEKDAATAVDSKTSASNIPLWMGVEGEAASWLTLRSAYSQKLSLYDTTKTSAAGVDGETTSGTSAATITAGAGLKFNKMTLDMNLSLAGAGAVNTTAIKTNAALTYYF